MVKNKVSGNVCYTYFILELLTIPYVRMNDKITAR